MKQLLAIASVVGITTMVNGQLYPCAPASHCDVRSALCKSSEYVQALIEGRAVPGETFETARGICTDAYRYTCTRDGKTCKKVNYKPEEAELRCWEILYTDRENREDNSKLKPNMFLEACPNGLFTCKDGRCVNSAGACGAAGVRYDSKRCAKDFCLDLGGNDVCKMNSTLLENSLECNDNVNITLNGCCVKGRDPQCEVVRLVKIDVEADICGGVCVPPICNGTVPIPTAKPTSKPTNKGATKSPTVPGQGSIYEITALAIGFEFTSKNPDCCCRLSCDCFGDPHCTDFFAHQVTSKAESGKYTMYQAQGFKFVAELGPPKGVIANVFVNIQKDPITYELNMETCTNASTAWKNSATNKYIPQSSWPAGWSVHESLGDPYSDPTTYYVRNVDAKIIAEIKCVSWFYLNQKGKYIASNRLDVQLTKWNDLITRPDDETCCRSETENQQYFKAIGASGFCVGDRNVPGAPKTDTIAGSNAYLDSVLGFSTTGNEAALALLEYTSDEAQKLCEEYIEKVKAAGEAAVAALSDLDKCIQNVLDFGLGSLQRLIDALDEVQIKCIADANDPRLTKPLQTCEEGLILEVKAPNGKEWIQLRWFPAGLKYCDNMVILDFSRTFLPDGTQVTSAWEFRIVRCQPPIDICGDCAALTTIDDVYFKFLYECVSYDGLKDTIAIGLFDAVKSGAITCGFKYAGNSDPIACMREKFPEHFKNVVITSETTNAPTKKMTNPPTKKVTNPPGVAPTKGTTHSGGDLKICGDILKKENCIARPGCEWDNAKGECGKK